MVCCINPNCPKPQNPDGTKFCQSCGVKIIPLLRSHYRIIKPIGRGGFGKTYLAEDIDKLKESCVVKQFAPNVQGSWAVNKAVQLFQQEAQQLQDLGSHPQIPTLYAYFEEEGYMYLVQQFIDGDDLLKVLAREGAWGEREIRQLLLSLLPVLQFIHSRKIIHRDVKPDNIIRDSKGELVLIDFGVSKQLSGTIMTTTMGTTIGSQGYAALEQMEGGEAYPASDLFSLGVTCFHLLSQKHPYSLWIKYGYSWLGNWREHLPNPVSDDLGRILDRLLVEDVQQRYQSVDHVLDDLQPPPPQRFVTQPSPPPQPSVTPPSPPPQRFVTPPSPPKLNWLKNRWLVGSAIFLLGFIGTQIYGYARYQLSPFTQIFLITSFHSRLLLKKTLTGHSSSVLSIAFSPDSNTLASGSYKTIKLWNLRTNQEIATLTGHSHFVTSVAFSPDGNTLASGSGDKTIKLWNLRRNQVIATLTGHSSPVYSVAFSPDGNTLASGSGDNTIKLWNLKTNQKIATLTGHSDTVNSVAFSPDGNTLASGSFDNTIGIWNLRRNQEIATLTEDSFYVNSVAFSPDGNTLASGSRDNTIKLWRVSQ